jgi:hypothetical protein
MLFMSMETGFVPHSGDESLETRSGCGARGAVWLAPSGDIAEAVQPNLGEIMAACRS